MPDLPPIQRDAFLASLAKVAADAAAAPANLGLLLIDISNLGLINRRLGYALGDRMLATAHTELLAISKLPDTVFRVGGHGFAFLLPVLQNPGFIALAMNRVQRVLESSLALEDGQMTPAVRIGVGISRDGSKSAHAVLAQAEASLGQVKLGRALAIDELLAEKPAEPADTDMEQRFAEALHDNALTLNFQPQVEVGSGNVCGAEALLRWQPEGYGAVPADRVVRMAEESGKLYELTKWVLHHALRSLRQWGDRYSGPLSVNIPASMVGHPDLVNMIHDALSIWGVTPARLTVEITEDAVVEDSQAGYHILQGLLDVGVNIAIDDFGTGYSSLSYFQYMPARELKIDKSFVQRMADSPRDQELVRIIIEIAHLFDLAVVAEGVEDETTEAMLQALSCDIIQGYLYTPALPAEAFLDWIAGRTVAAS